MKDKIEKRLNELKVIYKQIQDSHELNRRNFERNKDSISLRDKVISDENSGYICEIWGRINELENILEKLQ